MFCRINFVSIKMFYSINLPPLEILSHQYDEIFPNKNYHTSSVLLFSVQGVCTPFLDISGSKQYETET